MSKRENLNEGRAYKIDFAVGGQAVIEGVMMRSPNFIATSVRKKNGEMKTKSDSFQSIITRFRLLRIPLIRGVVNLVEMMIIGMHAVNFSAQEYVEEEETQSKDKSVPVSPQSALFATLSFAFSIILSIGLAIFLFKFIPLAITELIRAHVPFVSDNYLAFNAIDGTIRIAIFFSYLGLLSLIKDFRRVFEYHGAEHKSIFAYEKDLPLTVENARRQSRFHPRCGTSFIIFVLLMSIVVYTFVPRDPVFVLNLLKRLFVLPLIAALSYEFLKWSAKNQDSLVVRFFTKPGLYTQRITTREPDDGQLEVALQALKTTLELEKKKISAGFRLSPG